MAANRSLLTFLTLGLFATAAVLAPATRSIARDISATTVELSAQQDQNKDGRKRKGTNVQQHNNQPKQQFQRKVIIKQNKQINVQKNIQVQKNVQKKVTIVQPGVHKYVGQPKVFTPTHNNLVYNFRLKGANQAFVNGRNYPVFYNNYRRSYNGRFYTFVALGVLAPLAIGAAIYYPYAYLDVPQPYCSGLTEDGCEMVYSEVETVEGDLIPQCAAYCPWQ